MSNIQGSLNAVVGAAAGAALAGKNAKEAAAKKEEAGELAKEQYFEASAELTGLEGEADIANKALEAANNSLEATKKWNMEGKNKKMLEGKIQKRMTEREAAQRAFTELQDRIESKKAMMSRAEKIMKRTGTWGGMR